MKNKSRDLGKELVGLMILERIRPAIIAEMFEAGMNTRDVIAKFA